MSQVRLLTADDVDALLALRREALVSHPLAFSASVEEEQGRSNELVVDDPNRAAVFGAFDGSKLVGMVGVFRHNPLKTRHRAQIWGMYVSPAGRRAGLGRALLAAAVEHARSWPGVVQVQLSVAEGAVDARRLYERAGFRAWGLEPRSLQWQDEFADEYHLVLPLDERF